VPHLTLVGLAGCCQYQVFHRLVATLVVLRYLASASAPIVGVEEEAETQLGDFLVSPFACCWHLRMRCAGVCGGAAVFDPIAGGSIEVA